MFQNNEQQNNKPINSNFIVEDKLLENRNNLPSDDSKCIKNVNDIHNTNNSNTDGSDILKPLTMTNNLNPANNNSDSKLIETKTSNDSSELSDTESKYLMAVLQCSTDVDVDSQDEKIISNIAKKYIKHIFPSSTEQIEMNTQHFMDLNLLRATLHLQKPNLNVSKEQPVEHSESDDSVVITTPSKKLEKFNNKFSKTNVELTNQSENEELQEIIQEEDSEIINFRAMCEAMTNIGTVDNQMPYKSNSPIVNNIVFKKINADVISVHSVECVQSTSKLMSSINLSSSNYTNDISKRSAHKRHHCNSPPLNLFSDSSPEYLNKLSQNLQFDYQKKKKKLSSPLNTLKMNSKSCSEKIVNQSDLKMIDLIVLTSSDDEEDCMLSKNQLSKENTSKKNYKRKRVTNNLPEQNKMLIGNEQIFYCSPNGLIHRDMMNYISKKNGILK